MRHFLIRSLAVVFAASTLASACAAPTGEAQEYFRTAMSLIKARHINSDKADWPSLSAEAEALVADAETTADTYPAIRHVLARLGEKHSFLREPPREEARAAERSAGAANPGEPLPQWRLVEGKFGLVQLPQLDTIGGGGEGAGRTYTAAVKAGLAAMDRPNLCGWIVDLRENGGGNMWPMLQGLDPLLGSSPFGYFAAKGGQTVPWTRTAAGILPMPGASGDVEPAFRLDRQAAPVAILIGPRTASSGEMVALAFIGRAGVRTFGMPSAGLTTANVPHPLSDGAFLVITETTVRDRTGRDYDGSIMPDRQTSLADTESAAAEWLDAECLRQQQAS